MRAGREKMRRTIRTVLVLLTAICLLAGTGSAYAETLQECHKVTNTATLSTQKNKSQIKLWHAETAHPAVTEEINGIAEAWAEELGPELPKAGNNGKKNSRLDVEIRPIIRNCRPRNSPPALIIWKRETRCG